MASKKRKLRPSNLSWIQSRKILNVIIIYNIFYQEEKVGYKNRMKPILKGEASSFKMSPSLRFSFAKLQRFQYLVFHHEFSLYVSSLHPTSSHLFRIFPPFLRTARPSKRQIVIRCPENSIFSRVLRWRGFQIPLGSSPSTWKILRTRSSGSRGGEGEGLVSRSPGPTILWNVLHRGLRSTTDSDLGWTSRLEIGKQVPRIQNGHRFLLEIPRTSFRGARFFVGAAVNAMEIRSFVRDRD